LPELLWGDAHSRHSASPHPAAKAENGASLPPRRLRALPSGGGWHLACRKGRHLAARPGTHTLNHSSQANSRRINRVAPLYGRQYARASVSAAAGCALNALSRLKKAVREMPALTPQVRQAPEAKRMKASAAARGLVPERSTAAGRALDNSGPCIGAEIRCELSAQWRAARTRKAPDAPMLPPD